MKTILSAFTSSWKSRKQSVQLDDDGSPTIIKMNPETLKFLKSQNSNESLSKSYMGEEKHMEEENSPCAQSSIGTYNSETDRIKTFTIQAKGKDFRSSVFDRDDESGLLFVSCLDKWNPRLHSGTYDLAVGDRLLAANGCVIRSLGALKEMMLTHDSAYIDFMFMKYDSTAITKHWTERGMSASQKKGSSADDRNPSEYGGDFISQPGMYQFPSVLRGECAPGTDLLEKEDASSPNCGGSPRPSSAQWDHRRWTSEKRERDSHNYQTAHKYNLGEAKYYLERSKQIEGDSKTSEQASPRTFEFSHQSSGPSKLRGRPFGDGRPNLHSYHMTLNKPRSGSAEGAVSIVPGSSRRPKTRRVNLSFCPKLPPTFSEESIFGDRQSALGTLRHRLFI